ncbi:MAG: hypothetical protein AAF404_11580, partial [Pseudomonadota bacterium]
MRAVVSLQVWFFLSLAGCVAIVAATIIVCNHTYSEMKQARAEGSTRFNQARQSITDYQWLADNTLFADRAVNSGLIGLKEPWVWAEYLSS